jgi:hypothetical protein
MNKPTKKMTDDFKKAIKNWDWPDKTEKDIIECYKRDREDMGEILALIDAGRYKLAKEHIYILDTIVRDQIPQNLYSFIMDN